MNLILLVLAIVAFILSFMGPKIFEDLYFLSVWAIVCVVTIAISIVKNDRKDKSNNISKRISVVSSVCPYCNAQIDNGSKFCGECGKELPQGNICDYCGAAVNESDIYCEECGRNLKDGTYASANYEEKSSIDYMKILFSGLTGMGIGLLFLLIVGGSWYGYETYSTYRAEKAAREKFVADSLEQVRKDSIKLAEQKEKERLEAEKIENFRKKFTFSNIHNLLKHPNSTSFAEKCGLSLIYKESEKEEGYEEGEYFTYYEYAYGYDVEKGSKKDGSMGYTIKSTSNHSCYFMFIDASDVIRYFRFKNKTDADYLIEIAKDYGVIESRYDYYIPKKKSKGITYLEEFSPYDSGMVSFGLSKTPNLIDGWYEVMFDTYE